MKLSQLLQKLTGKFRLTIYRNDECICNCKFVSLSDYSPEELLEYMKWCEGEELKGLKVIDIQVNPNIRGAEVWIDVQ